MPRLRLPPTLRTKPRFPVEPPQGPKLWNAKRRIKSSVGLTPAQLDEFKLNSVSRWFDRDSKSKSTSRRKWQRHTFDDAEARAIKSRDWWTLDRSLLDKVMDLHPQLQRVSADVRTFISDNAHTLNGPAVMRILRNPAQYFARPANVPDAQRQQIYFPDPKDCVYLMRTPHLSPRYACFRVPLHFSKLHLQAYLRNVYGVEVVHIRSVVVQEKVRRKDPTRPYSQGPLFRPPSKKKMTVQLAKPFVYPEEVKSLTPWEHDSYWKLAQSLVKEQRLSGDWLLLNPDADHRKALAEQARQILQGKMTWTPTWQSLHHDARAMQGSAARPPPPPPLKS